MRAGKIALWLFIALVISGSLFAISFISDVDQKGGWDKMTFGFGTPYSVNDTKEMDLSGFTKIEISVSSSDTKLAFSDGQKVSAALTGECRTTNPDAVPYLDMEASGNTLTISVKRKTTTMIGYLSMNTKLDVSIPSQFTGDLVFNGSSGNLDAPSAKLNSMKAETSSGDISIGNMELNGDFVVRTSSGRLSLSGLQAGSAKISSSSGDRKIGFVSVGGDAGFTASSGKTTVEGISARTITLQSSSGDITAGAADASKTSAQTSSGRIDIRGIEGDAAVSTSSGDILLKFLRPGSEIRANCSSGKIELGLPSDAQFGLNATTASGDIKSAFTLDNAKAEKRSLRGQVGNGQTKINLSTSSGNIRIDQN